MDLLVCKCMCCFKCVFIPAGITAHSLLWFVHHLHVTICTTWYAPVPIWRYMIICTCIHVSEGECFAHSVCVCACVCVCVCVCVCLNMNRLACVWYISVSHLFLEHCGKCEVWISLVPVELTPVSLSARLLNSPVRHWIAAPSTDNPQTMSSTDSSTSTLYSRTSGGDTDHRRLRAAHSSPDASCCPICVGATHFEGHVKQACREFLSFLYE